MPIKRVDKQETVAFWHMPIPALLDRLQSCPQGLSQAEAAERLERNGQNRLRNHQAVAPWRLFLAQVKSSIVLILLFATAISFYLHDRLDASIILGIILLSALLGFWQEKGAADAVGKLLALVQVLTAVMRDGIEQELPVQDVVPGAGISASSGVSWWCSEWSVRYSIS